MKTIPLKVGGRTFELAFTLDAMCELQEEVEGFDLSKLSDLARTPKGLTQLLLALARQGELLNGRILDVGREWFGSHISPAPARIAKIQIAVLNALSAGMTMETDEEDEDEEHDVVLDEIKKKETPGG